MLLLTLSLSKGERQIAHRFAAVGKMGAADFFEAERGVKSI